MPTPEPTPAPAPAPMRADLTTVIASQSLDIDFPTGWTALNLQGEDIDQRLLQLEESGQERGEAWQAAVNQLIASVNDESTLWVALYEGLESSDSTMLPNLTAMQLPRNGLSFQVYLDESQRILGATDGVIVEKGEFDDGLLPSGAPAATLLYRLAYGTPEMRGYQVLFFDESAEQVVVMTFAATSSDFDEMLPIFRQVIRGVK